MDSYTLNLKYTPLYELHKHLGAKLVPFAGYALPVSYPEGIMQEHLHTRAQAGLFDVSHMGQVMLSGPDVASALEELIPVDLQALDNGQQSYGLLTNEQGGVIDDLMITRLEANKFLMVVNAACKEKDLKHLHANLDGIKIEYLEKRALIALQGPAAKTVMAEYLGNLDNMAFMQSREASIEGVGCYINRCGYTGEDGFEISIPADAADKIARLLLQHDEVKPVGLGARDTLRLEAGLCLYGHELNEHITPIEAALNWSISKSRRIGGSKEGGFPGAKKILSQMQNGVTRKRVGLMLEGRMAAREGAELVDKNGAVIGEVCSGGYAPSLSAPIAMAFVNTDCAEIGNAFEARVRNKSIPAIISKMPFVPNTYYRI